MHHGQSEGSIRSRFYEDDVIGQSGGFGPPYIYYDDPRTTAFCNLDLAQGAGLADRICTPKDHHIGVGAKVFLGRCLNCPSQANTKGAKTPADHRGVPVLAAIEIGETIHLGAL